jgi:DNA-binding response OmpR family regulator
MRILVIEDEPRMLELLRKGFFERGFTVMTAGDGVTGLEIASTQQADAIVLDIGMPGLDGFEVMKALRARQPLTPVLILTARDSEDDIIRGLELGADDYLTKPFSFPELVARLQSITTDRRNEKFGAITAGEIIFDPVRHSVTRCTKRIELTRQEFRLLECIVRRTGQCVSRNTLMDFVWGSEHAVGSGALDVLVNSLRAKIDLPYSKKLIKTIRGSGYLFAQDDSAVRGQS